MIEPNVTRIPFADVPQLSKTDCDYAVHPEIFNDFIAHKPDLEGLAAAIAT